MLVTMQVTTWMAWNLGHWASKFYRPVRKSLCVRLPDATFCKPYATFCAPLQISPFSEQKKQGWQCHWWLSFLTMGSEEQLSGFVSAGNNFHIVSSLFSQGSLDSFHQIRMDTTTKSPIRWHNYNQVVRLGFVCFTWGYFYLLIQSWKIKLTD